MSTNPPGGPEQPWQPHPGQPNPGYPQGQPHPGYPQGQPQGQPQQPGYPQGQPQPGYPQGQPQQPGYPQGQPHPGYPQGQQGWPQQGFQQGNAEYLASGGGQPYQPAPPGKKSRKGLLIGGGIGAVVLLGGGIGGAFAVMNFVGSGAQPAEVLPADTVAYASINLDPSGEQKVEALRMLNKFPAFKDNLDLGTDDDLRQAILDEAFTECDGVSFADDVEPWLGNRFAMAARPGGDSGTEPVVVLEVTDSGAAEAGIESLISACGASDTGGFVVDGDWAVLAESTDIAQGIVDAAGEGSLADTDGFQKWTAEAGGDGIATGYISADAGTLLTDYFRDEAGTELTPEMTDQAIQGLSEFGGMAATLRFNDGGLEVEWAGDAGPDSQGLLSENAGEALASLPADTSFAFGAGFQEGWLTLLADRAAAAAGQGQTGEEMLSDLSGQLGFEAADLEALFGESVAISAGNIDLNALESGGGMSELPIGLKVKGDEASIEAALTKIRSIDPSAGEVLVSDAGNGYVVVSPSETYRQALLADGGLGDSEVFQNVIPEAGRNGAVLFVNLDAGDWSGELADQSGDPNAAANIEPLSAIGAAGWLEGDVAHGILRVTTN